MGRALLGWGLGLGLFCGAGGLAGFWGLGPLTMSVIRVRFRGPRAETWAETWAVSGGRYLRAICLGNFVRCFWVARDLMRKLFSWVARSWTQSMAVNPESIFV